SLHFRYNAGLTISTLIFVSRDEPAAVLELTAEIALVCARTLTFSTFTSTLDTPKESTALRVFPPASVQLLTVVVTRKVASGSSSLPAGSYLLDRILSLRACSASS